MSSTSMFHDGKWHGIFFVFAIFVGVFLTLSFFSKPNIQTNCGANMSRYEIRPSIGGSSFFNIPNEYISGSQARCGVAKRSKINLWLTYPTMKPFLNDKEALRSSVIELSIVPGTPDRLTLVREGLIFPPGVDEDFGIGNDGLIFLGFNQNPSPGYRGRSYYHQPGRGVVEAKVRLFHYVPQKLAETHVGYISCAYGGDFRSEKNGTFVEGTRGRCFVKSKFSDYAFYEYSIPAGRLQEWHKIDDRIHSVLDSFSVYPADIAPASLEIK